MPKLPKSFGRRRSTANTLEDIENSPPVQPSFRVFERPDGAGKSFDGGMKLAKFSPKPNSYRRQNEDNMFEDLKFNRGSGASNTNTASTTDNSSRLSAASTTPSSTDLPGQEDLRSPHDKPFHDIPVPAVPKSAPAFSLKAAGRTFSFGRGKLPSAPATTEMDEPPPLPPKNSDDNLRRDRAVTASSYASTATPLKLEEKELGLSLGGDFGDMFSNFGKRKSAVLDVNQNTGKQLTDYASSGLSIPARSYAGNRMNQPSPLTLDRTMNVSPSPNSWNSQHSQDGLIANSSPMQGPPVPRHGSPQAQNPTLNGNNATKPPQASLVRDPRLTRKPLVSKQSTSDYADTTEEDASLLKDSANTLRRLTESPVNMRARDSWLGPLSNSQSYVPLQNQSSPKAEPVRTPQRMPKVDPEDNLFDQHIIADADVLQQYEQIAATPPPERTHKNKVMTPAQFERYRQEQDRLKMLGGQSKDEENEEEDDAYEDDEDEAEKQKQVVRQRRKQEAHMAVYRQQMMKVTGEASPSSAAPLMRSSMQHSRSSLNLLNNAPSSPEEEEEDEEVPLAILAAHGFPNKTRPPSQLPTMHSNPNLRASSMMGAHPAPQSVAGDPTGGASGGRLPVFARKLPEDPYFGAGLLNHTNRESLALGNGAGSVHGGSTRGATPGGLVGVIATEERSRAMRRGSPNAAGEYGLPPSNGFNGMGMPPNIPMPPMGRAMTMPNGMGPMLTVGDQAQLEMAAQMQQFMQMQMQFMQMMTSNQGLPQSQNAHPVPMQGLPPMGVPLQQGIRPVSSHERTMSMLDPNSAPWQQGQRNTMYAPPFQNGGYAPSIAPSERSNVGLPGRYRPVSQYAGPDKSRAATMSGAIQDWSDSKQGATTVKTVKNSVDVSDEDDEEGWEAMKQKREKKRSIWRSKKDDNTSGTMKDLWAYATKSG